MRRLIQTAKSPILRDDSLTFACLSSCLLHLAVLVLASMITSHTGELHIENYQRVTLLELPQVENEISQEKREIPPEIKKPLPQIEKAKVTSFVKNDMPRPARPMPPTAPAEEEVPKAVEASPPLPAQPPPLSPAAKVEGGGSRAGAGNLFGKGDVAVVPGEGTIGGGSGTADSGLGKGSGAPGTPAILKTNREARPIQTARASYPPTALRMGIEGDVTLRIQVDTEGKVMRAEVSKSAGSGFDEEALKAVKQSRFEPAEKDGKNVPAEFTYIYHFRLTR